MSLLKLSMLLSRPRSTQGQGQSHKSCPRSAWPRRLCCW